MPEGTIGTISPNSPENYVRLVKRLFFDGFSGGHLEVVEEVFSPDTEFNAPGAPPGIEGIKAMVKKNNSAMSDWQFHIDDMISDGDKTAVRWHATGNHTGSFMGEEPTGKAVILNGLVIYQIENNRIVRNWLMGDNLGFLNQLGLVALPKADA